MRKKRFTFCKRYFWPLILIWAFSHALFAQDEGVGYTTYYFTDSGGNSVTTTSLNLAKKVLSKTVFLMDLELDNVYVPPVTAVTGATRPSRDSGDPFEKTRGQAIVGIEQGVDPNTSLAVNYYYSQEVDYTSNSAIITVTKELNQKNTTVSVRSQVVMDQVGKILDNGDLENQGKNSAWVVARLSQVISSTAIADFSYDGLYHQGFLSDPYRQVRVFDQNFAFTNTDEKHPDSRLRHAFSARINKMIPDVGTSMMAQFRLYFDDWSVSSQTLEFQFNKYIVEDVIARFNYRFYTQTAAYFFQERYAGDTYLQNAFRTADYKLQGFNSNNFGFSVTYLFKKMAEQKRSLQFLENASAEVRYFRYFNSLAFSANIFQLNLNLGF